jgi:hypothetical protein
MPRIKCRGTLVVVWIFGVALAVGLTVSLAMHFKESSSKRAAAEAGAEEYGGPETRAGPEHWRLGAPVPAAPVAGSGARAKPVPVRTGGVHDDVVRGGPPARRLLARVPDTIYYGEYRNYGPGAAVGEARVLA